MEKGLHCFVSGKVQGVCFRLETQAQAKRLGLTGWVRNLTDGRVEVMACGDEQQLNRLCQWLQSGPPLARVEKLEITTVASRQFPGFTIR